MSTLAEEYLDSLTRIEHLENELATMLSDLQESCEYGEKLHLLAQGTCEHCRGNPCVKQCMCPEPPPWVGR